MARNTRAKKNEAPKVDIGAEIFASLRELEKIKGIGPRKAKLLLSKMSLSEIRTADEKSLADIKGISAADAHEIYEYFKEKRKEGTTRVKNNHRNS